MIDWLVALAPLVAPPIVLLLGFTGCGFPNINEFVDVVVFQWDNGFDITDIDGIDVTSTYQPDFGQEATSNLVANVTLTPSVLALAGSVELSLEVNDKSSGLLRCSCHIKMKKGQPIDKHQLQNKEAGVPLAPFVLSRIGNVFDLSVQGS
jgi:hypothetical protein